MENRKKRIFEIIQIGSREDVPSTLFDLFIITMIVLSIATTFLQTFDSLAPYRGILNGIELFTIVAFIIEYGLRLWTSEFLYGKGLGAVWKFIFSFYGLVDLLTIISYFAPLYSNGIVALRMIRVIRIMRLFRVNAQSDAFTVIAEVIADKRKQLLSSLFMIAMIMLAASLCMYGFEHEAQPEVFANAFSGIWWAMSTVLTIGYGDIYPITTGGKIIAILIALLGVCVVAIPTGVVSAGFVEYYARIRDEMNNGLKNELTRQAKKANMDEAEYLAYLLKNSEKIKK